MTRLILLFILLMSCGQKHIEGPISAELLEFLSRSYKFEHEDNNTMHSDFILVKNYSGSEEDNIYLDSIVFNHVGESYKQFEHFSVFALKQSRSTNREYLQKYPDALEHKSLPHDMIYIYKWDYGSFVSRRGWNE